MEYPELWEKASVILKQELGDISFQTFLVNGLEPLGLDGNIFCFEGMSDFYLDYITQRYIPSMVNALTTVVGKPMGVKLLNHKEAAQFRAVGQAKAVQPKLNPKYTFDTFVVGSNNRFAHAVSLAVAESPADAYNPLFIYGGAGLGKTHLLHAIGNYILEKDPLKRILYVTTEAFTNDLISAIQAKRNTEFRDRYRSCDVLLVDDIQFLARAERTQEEFFHTFNALHNAGKQIVITSDKPPKEIPKLEERLSSRFEWGLIADIQKPDFETRVAILQRKAQDEMLLVEPEVLSMIAERVDTNIRELEGCLTKLSAYSTLTKRPITVALAKEALSETFRHAEPKRLSQDDVMNAVANYYSVSVADLLGTRRNREVVVPRQIAMYLCRTLADMSFPRIGEAFKRDHSTIQHGCDKVAEQMKDDSSFASIIADITRQLKER